MNKKLIKNLLLFCSTAAVLNSAVSCSSFDSGKATTQTQKQKQLFQKKVALETTWKNLISSIKVYKNEFFFINQKIQDFWRLILRLRKSMVDVNFSLENVNLSYEPSNINNVFNTNHNLAISEILNKYFDEKNATSLFNFAQKSSILSLDIIAQFELHSSQLQRDTSSVSAFLNVFNNVEENKIMSVEETQLLRTNTTRYISATRDEIKSAILNPKLSNLTAENYNELNKIINPDTKHSFFHSHAMINIILELIMLIDNSFKNDYIIEIKNLKSELENNNLLNSSVDKASFDEMIKIIDDKQITPIWSSLSQKTNSFVEVFNDIANYAVNIF